MFQTSRALQLFPTVVFQHVLQHPEALNRKLEKAITRLRRERPTWKGHTSPWQCAPDLHEQPTFQPLVEAVHEAVRIASEGLHHDIDGHRITGMWATWLRAGEFHPPHAHANNFWSGVYWVRCDERAGGRLTFAHPNPASRVMVPKMRELTMANSGSWSLDAEPGVLVLFPSWLSHHVEAVPTGERISVAFNVMLTGEMLTPDTLQYARIG